VLSEDDRFFILASDGVWDYMTNEEVMDVCTSAGDPLKAAEALAAEASERWNTRDADHRRDDITALILRVQLAAPEAAAVAESAAQAE
jgi:serine/threonine protein phosphatase PrpC